MENVDLGGLGATRPTFEQKLHSVASPSAMQLTMKQAKMILYLQRRHALELLAQPGVCGVNVKAHGVETQVFRSQKQPQYEEQRDGGAGNHFSTMTARPAARGSLADRFSASLRSESWREKKPRNQSRTQPRPPPLPATPPAAKVPRTTESSIPEEKPPQTPRDVELAHLAEVAGTDLSVAEFALDDAGGDADKALTTLLYANEQWKAAEKAAAERKAAEEATEAGWAAAELLAKVEQAEKEKKTAKIKEKQAAENAAAKEGKVQAAKAKEQAAKVAKEARAQAVKVAKEAKAQAEKTAKEAKESKAQAAEAKAQVKPAPTPTPSSTPSSTSSTSRSTPTHRPAPPAQLPHTDSHEQKKPHVGVNVAGHKTQPKTEATGTKAKASTLSAPKPPKPDAPDTGQSAAFG
jgi:hypothetical protein